MKSVSVDALVGAMVLWMHDGGMTAKSLWLEDLEEVELLNSSLDVCSSVHKNEPTLLAEAASVKAKPPRFCPLFVDSHGRLLGRLSPHLFALCAPLDDQLRLAAVVARQPHAIRQNTPISFKEFKFENTIADDDTARLDAYAANAYIYAMPLPQGCFREICDIRATPEHRRMWDEFSTSLQWYLCDALSRCPEELHRSIVGLGLSPPTTGSDQLSASSIINMVSANTHISANKCTCANTQTSANTHICGNKHTQHTCVSMQRSWLPTYLLQWSALLVEPLSLS